jgi:uncharacterized protein YgbK (DUF1537 family)
MESILVLADDLTGALEAGAKFAAHNFRAVVTTRRGRPLDSSVTVVDTETRHLSPQDAAAAISAFIPAGAHIIYKKTDSALRGNIGCEIRALVQAFPGAKLSYIPAYPEMGRTARGGSVSIHGVPAHLSDFAQDSLNPISTSSIAELLGPDLPCTIHDGETLADVRIAVAAALSVPGPHIIAGPASVAAALAAHLRPQIVAQQWPRIKKCLVVNGSRHPASLGQIRHAIQRGCLSSSVTAPWRHYSFAESGAFTSIEFASALGASFAREVDLTAPDAVMVFGGDTGFGIMEAMNCPDLEPMGEILAGVPISRIAGRRPYLITKAGSFGEQDVICQVKGLL